MIEFIRTVNRRPEMCNRIPDVYMPCEYVDCSRCVVADRYRRDQLLKDKTILMLDNRHVLRQTPKGGGEDFYQRPIVLKESVMEQLGIPVHFYYQMAIAYDGPGCFIKNPVGEINIYLFADPSKKYLIHRHEAYGVPNEQAVKRYNDLFLMGIDPVKKYR